jgi:competence ComEA-like helix-hairpin-helix protein
VVLQKEANLNQQPQILIPLFCILILTSIATVSQYLTRRQNQFTSQPDFIDTYCKGQSVKNWRPAKRQLCNVGIFLNSDHADALVYLPNIGPKRARAIEQYRRTHGPFKSLDELNNISGIGPATIQRIQPWIEDVSANAMHPQQTSPPDSAK